MSASNARARKIIETKGDLPPEEERAAKMVSDYRVRGTRGAGFYQNTETDATNQRAVGKQIRGKKD